MFKKTEIQNQTNGVTVKGICLWNNLNKEIQKATQNIAFKSMMRASICKYVCKKIINHSFV